MCRSIKLSSIGRENAGHPHPESNLAEEQNNGWPVVISTYIPGSKLPLYSFAYGGSVAACWVTSYCNGVRMRRSSLSLFKGKSRLFLLDISMKLFIRGCLTIIIKQLLNIELFITKNRFIDNNGMR